MANTIAATLAAELRGQRHRRRLTQVELAERSGVAYKTLVRLENAQRRATAEQLLALAHALGVPATVLLPDLAIDPTESAQGAA
jgi:transcriptional regulator with XRE-family HTH domain